MTARRPVAPSARMLREAGLGAAGLGAAVLLRSSFTAKAGSVRFYVLTASLAGTWAAGALSAGRAPWRGAGRDVSLESATRALTIPVATGAVTFAGFYLGARAARRHRPLRRAIVSVLGYAEAGSTPLVLVIAAGSGIAEERFFRGALWSGRYPLRTSTLAYAASAAASGNPALVLAGVVTSLIFGWQRDVTGGVFAPAVAHVTWSVLMLRYLPRLFREDGEPTSLPGIRPEATAHGG